MPASLYKPEDRKRAARLVRIVIATVAVLLAGWQVLGLPGQVIKRNIAPPDLRGKEYGMRDLWIEADGTWTIQREGYLDRKELYVIRPGGTLTRIDEAPGSFEGKDISGVPHGSPTFMARGSGIKIKASPRFWLIRRQLRPGYQPPPATEEDAAAEREFDLPTYVDPTRDQYVVPEDDATQHERYVELRLYYGGAEHRREILTGHEFFPSVDSWAFADPDLWITTDSQRHLHRLYASDREGEPEIRSVLTVPLEFIARTGRDCVLGIEPHSGELFLLLMNGTGYWLDPLELKLLREDELPGEWRHEHASIAFSRLGHSFDQGAPLSEAAYRRLMAVLMVVFLASLLILANEGRNSWKFTAAATTADSSSSTESSSTSPNSDTPA